MGQTKVRSAHGTDERGDGSKGGGFGGSIKAIDDGFAIGLERGTGERFTLIIGHVVEDDFAGDSFAAERGEFIEATHDDDFSGEAVGGSGGASAECGEDDALRNVVRLSGIFGELGSFFAAHPM